MLQNVNLNSKKSDEFCAAEGSNSAGATYLLHSFRCFISLTSFWCNSSLSSQVQSETFGVITESVKGRVYIFVPFQEIKYYFHCNL